MKTDQEKIDFYNSHFEEVENPDEWISISKRFEEYFKYVELLAGIGNMLTEVQENKRPMLSQIATVNMGEKMPIISLWGGVGDENPIERIENEHRINRCAWRNSNILLCFNGLCCNNNWHALYYPIFYLGDFNSKNANLFRSI